MNLLIVDDEVLLREKLKTLVEHSTLPFQRVFTAENAVEALLLLEQECPDVVVSDIRMPSKTGLELAEHIYRHYPQIPVILVTGYSDFEYARAAIHSHVMDYLLKPVEADKFLKALSRAVEKLTLTEKHARLHQMFRAYFESNLPTIRRQFVETLLFHRGTGRDEERYVELFGGSYKPTRLVAMQCTTSIDGNRLEGEYYCSFLVEKFLLQLLPKTMSYVFGDLVFFLWEIREEDPFEDNQALLTLLKNIHSHARVNFLGSICAGISQRADSLSQIQDRRLQASDCLDYQRESRDPYIFYDDLPAAQPKNSQLEHGLSQLVSALRSGSPQRLGEEWAGLSLSLQESPEDYVRTALLYMVSHVSFLLYELGFDAQVVHENSLKIHPALESAGTGDCLPLMGQWLEEVGGLVVGEFQARSNTVVSGVKEFIQQKYSQPVGLAEASRQVGRNPSYISRLIREHTGKSFTQLLTDKRMAEAKRLLKETGLKITEISQQVGYCNVRYFNRVFKATMHMSANDYRNFNRAFES